MINIEKLNKVSSSQKILKDMNLKVNYGEAFGILGGTASGKTVLMRLMMNFMLPDSGSIQICGFDAQKETAHAHRKIAYIPENPIFYDNLDIADTIRYGYGKFMNKAMKEKKKFLLNQFNLDKKAIGWELNQDERVLLATLIAIIRDPEVILADSPFDHLHPSERALLLEHFYERKEKGKGLILSSNNENDLLSICDRYALLENGKITEIKDICSHMDEPGVFVLAKGHIENLEDIAYKIILNISDEYQFFYRGNLSKLFNFLEKQKIDKINIKDAKEDGLYEKYFGGKK